MAANIMTKQILQTNQKPKCEMCGNEALPNQTLCKEHLDVRTAEQMKAREFVSKPIHKDLKN